MDRIIKSHVKSFQESSGLQDLSVEDAFEHFVNYCVGYKFTGTPFDTNGVTTDDPDAGIDGVIFLVDNEIVCSAEDAQEIFRRSKKNVEARLIFTQSTVSDGFEKAKLTNFNSGAYDFLQDKPEQPHGAVLKEHHRLLGVIIDNASKVVNGKPECEIYYSAAGRFNEEAEIVAAATAGRRQLLSLNLFSSVTIHFLGSDALLRLWLECSQTISASIEVIGFIPLPKTENVSH
ncbi:MAG: hypothetical protein MUE46_07220 [Xanthomonadales bacterium]|nr:hypothetical protein [Xanthomonadales bacterium]